MSLHEPPKCRRWRERKPGLAGGRRSGLASDSPLWEPAGVRVGAKETPGRPSSPLSTKRVPEKGIGEN